jgi:hypothetical protein
VLEAAVGVDTSGGHAEAGRVAGVIATGGDVGGDIPDDVTDEVTAVVGGAAEVAGEALGGGAVVTVCGVDGAGAVGVIEGGVVTAVVSVVTVVADVVVTVDVGSVDVVPLELGEAGETVWLVGGELGSGPVDDETSTSCWTRGVSARGVVLAGSSPTSSTSRNAETVVARATHNRFIDQPPVPFSTARGCL